MTMKIACLLTIFCFVLAGNLLAVLNEHEYRMCIFDLKRQVNGTNAVDFILRDGGNVDEHSYKGNMEEAINWVNIESISSNSLYSPEGFTFARVSRKNATPYKKDGALKLQFVNDCTETEHNHPNKTVYCHVLCLYDETGNDTLEDDTSFAALSPKNVWRDKNTDNYTDYSEGLLWYTNWHGLAYHDVDVWKLNGLEKDKIYCVEVKTLEKSDPHLQLEIIQFGNNPKTVTEQNVFAEDGSKDGKTYRIYFCAERTDTVAKISFYGSEQHFNTKYKIALMQCKPVVLIHGFRGHPRNSGDSETDFGKLREFIGYINNVRPCVCLEFPWNSGDGTYKDYVGGKNDAGTLYYYLNESNKFFHAKSTIMTYSTGGTMLYDQMARENLKDVMENAVIVAAPFWGVHIAKPFIGISFPFWSNASSAILRDLSRGSAINWQRKLVSSKWHTWRKDVTIVIGTGVRTTLRGAVYYANHFGKEVNELKDSHRGDGLVAYHSANLRNKHSEVNFFDLSLGHDVLVEFELSDLGLRKPFFEDFINKVNSWDPKSH